MRKILGIAIVVTSHVSVTLPARADIYDANVYCRVAKIRTGQLALRRDDKSKAAFAGLNNGDRVKAVAGIYEDGIIWDSVRVIKSSNLRLQGKEGIVNAGYLSCDWYSFDGKFIRHEEAKGR